MVVLCFVLLGGWWWDGGVGVGMFGIEYFKLDWGFEGVVFCFNDVCKLWFGRRMFGVKDVGWDVGSLVKRMVVFFRVL